MNSEVLLPQKTSFSNTAEVWFSIRKKD